MDSRCFFYINQLNVDIYSKIDYVYYSWEPNSAKFLYWLGSVTLKKGRFKAKSLLFSSTQRVYVFHIIFHERYGLCNGHCDSFLWGTTSSFNLLKPRGFFTYHQVRLSKILHGARFALSDLYGYQNRQRLLFYTSLTDWFYNRGGKCLQRGTDWFLI